MCRSFIFFEDIFLRIVLCFTGWFLLAALLPVCEGVFLFGGVLNVDEPRMAFYFE
ncbi:hypothetical protein CCP2SC5_520013 [Azospirillaceae bacterium]